MRKDLLELVCKDLDKKPPFNFGTWVEQGWEGKPDLSCGAAACALGRATTIPEIAALGLRLVLEMDDDIPFSYITDGKHAPGDVEDPSNAVEASLAAASRVFEITELEARFLFMPEEEDNGLSPDVSAATVARHIRDFMRREGLTDQTKP